MLTEIVVPASRPRSNDTDYLVERYHRAFDDEMKLLRVLLRPWREPLRGVHAALDTLSDRLDAHEKLQELRLFPAFESGSPCPPALFEAWAGDALALFGTLDVVRAACRTALVAPSLTLRIQHFVDEVQDHLAAEAKLLSPWAGFGA